MDPSHHFAAGGEPPRRPPHTPRNQLQGPRPSPLQLSKTSHTIKKPPLHPPLHHHHHHHHQYQQSQPATAAVTTSDDQPLQPTIIYAVSPKVIHVQESEFRSIVQRLTGLSTTATTTSTGELLSPAARLASIERTSPTERETSAAVLRDDDDLLMSMLEGVEFLQGQFPSILSPAPATLPGIPPTIFSPATDLQNLSFFQEFSSPRFWQVNSPSPLLSGSIVSPGTPSVDLFSLFSDFS